MRLLSLLLLASLCSAQDYIARRPLAVPVPPPGITYRGGISNHDDGSSATIASTSTLNVQAGDLVVVVAGVAGNLTGSGSCGSDSLSQIKTWYDSTQDYTVRAWVVYGASANSAATCTINFSGSGTFRFIAAANWGGIAASAALDQSSCNVVSCDALTSDSTGRTAQNINTTQASELLLGVAVDWDGGLTHTGANSFVVRIDGNTVMFADRIVSSTGTYPSGNFTTASPAQRYLSFFFSFRAAE